MRWLLTGDEFDAAEAHRIGLVQEIVPARDAQLERALEIAETIAAQAPLGVQNAALGTTIADGGRRDRGPDATILGLIRPPMRRKA